MILRYDSDDGRSVCFGGASPFALTGVSGIHGLGSQVHHYAQYLQDGTRFVSSQLKGRGIALYGLIDQDVVQNRLLLLRTLSPKEMGWLTLERGDFVRRIRCVVEQAPVFDRASGAIFSLKLYAPSPYWEAPDILRTDIAAWESGIQWPLAFPQGGFSFGWRTQSRVVNVHNGGDVDAGMIISFLARGSVSDPALFRVDGSGFMRVEVDLDAGDRVEISTVTGDKWVRLHRIGQESVNAFGMLDPESSFLQLSRGDNLFRFEAMAGADVLDVSVRFGARYLGV